MKRSRFPKITIALTVLAVIICTQVLSYGAYAKESLSPAIGHLSQEKVFIKNGMKNSAVKFTADEFEDALGCARLSSITVLVLPDESDGKLMLGSVPVLANQVITRGKLSKLSFVPAESGVRDASFVFGCISSGYPRVMSCSVRFTDTLNFAPGASESSISAYAGVTVSDFLRASDPDGDSMTFTIVSHPSSGALTLSDSSSGEYIYTPDKNTFGRDSFSFVAVDCYGNSSRETEVTVEIKKAPQVNYVDIPPELEHCALLLADKGIFIGRSVGKYHYFDRNEPVSYDEFIIMAMSAAGISLPENDRDIISAFAEISDIAVSAGEEISTAKALEIAREIHEGTLEVSALPSGELTREHAARIIYEMLR